MDSCSYFVKCNSNSRVQFLKVSSSFSVLKNGTENNEIMFYDIGLDVKEVSFSRICQIRIFGLYYSLRVSIGGYPVN